MGEEMDIVEKAKEFAIKAHGSQKYGEHPYSYHLEKVAGAAAAFTCDPIYQAVAWLHDVLEDTDTNISSIINTFGPFIADTVHDLTDKPGKNRLEKHLNTYSKLRKNKIAKTIKLCDRLVNMQESVGKDIGKMYKKEYLQFKFAFYEPGEHKEIWNALDATYKKL